MSIKIQTPLGLALLAMALSLSFSQKVQASPIGSVTFKDNAPFAGCSTATPLSSADGLLTVAAWADNDATTSASLYQWPLGRAEAASPASTRDPETLYAAEK